MTATSFETFSCMMLFASAGMIGLTVVGMLSMNAVFAVLDIVDRCKSPPKAP